MTPTVKFCVYVFCLLTQIQNGGGGGLERLDFDFFSHVSFVRVPSPGCELPPPAADHRTAPAHPCAQGGLMI
jgi:hypothetical protein